MARFRPRASHRAGPWPLSTSTSEAQLAVDRDQPQSRCSTSIRWQAKYTIVMLVLRARRVERQVDLGAACRHTVALVIVRTENPSRSNDAATSWALFVGLVSAGTLR